MTRYKEGRTNSVTVHKSFDEFAERYSPTEQYKALANPTACILCERYPTLANVRAEYGTGDTMKWLISQMITLSQFCGASNKLTDIQLTEVAQIIIHRYFYMKVTEFMLFFQWVKEGRYGQFYGSVDPQKLLIFMEMFKKERNTEIEKDEQRRRDLQREKDREGAVSYPDYCKMSGLDPQQPPLERIMNQTEAV